MYRAALGDRGSFRMNYLVLLAVFYCTAVLQAGPRSCSDHMGWVASFIAFEFAAHCAIGK